MPSPFDYLSGVGALWRNQLLIKETKVQIPQDCVESRSDPDFFFDDDDYVIGCQ